MSDITIDSSLAAINTGPKTLVKEQPAKGKDPQTPVAFNSNQTTVKELRAQHAQLGKSLSIHGSRNRILQIRKKTRELTLKDKLLRQIRKVAYTICSYREESERRPGFKSIMDIFEALVCKSQIPYIGLRQGMNPNSPLLSKTAINILRIYLCLDPNTLPISEYRPQSISDKADQIYYSIKPWSGTREFYEAKERAIHHSGPTRMMIIFGLQNFYITVTT